MVEIYYIYGEPDYHIHGWNFITFMVRNFITFMLDFYHFYVGYYIYGWLLNDVSMQDIDIAHRVPVRKAQKSTELHNLQVC